MGQGQPDSDIGDPKLDIDSAMLMKAKPLKFQKTTTQSSKEQEAIKKPVSRRPADALTAAVVCALEDTLQAPSLRSHPSHQKPRSPRRRG